MQSFKDIWEKALVILKNELSDTSYESWIRLMIPMKMENDTAYFCVTTLFQKSILDKKYRPAVEEALSNVMGCPLTVKIMTEDEVPPRFREIAQKKNDEISNILTEMEEEESRAFTSRANLTFENFVLGKENEFAYATALAVSSEPGGTEHNPYFLYGHSGLGKTHLINAIANKIRERRPDTNIIYVKGDEFTSELVASISTKSQHLFKNKYRSADVLMVDDVQFIGGNTSIQEELFHTIDALYESDRQIVLTSDRPPKELVTLEERLQSRFSQGWLIDIQPPEYETRVAIVMQKAELYNLVLPNEVAELIASKIKTNVRELEGTVKKLKAYHSLWGQQPTMSLAKDAMESVIRESSTSSITPTVIIDQVSRYYNISVETMKSASRLPDVVNARKMAIYIIREMTGLSLPEIGKELGGKNHTTVLYSYKTQYDRIHADPKVAKETAEIMENIKRSY